MRRSLALLTLTATVAAMVLVASPTAGALAQRGYGYRSWLKGDPTDVRVTTMPGVMLEGGRADRRDAWAWFLQHAGYGDILILCATCDAAYNPYVMSTHAVDSVQTLKLTKRRAAFDPFVLASMQSADGVFIAGGDQSDYVRIWRDTPIAAAIDALIARGGPVGGISAGLAVLGNFVFAAQKNTITSKRALLDCFNHKITLRRDMLQVPDLVSTIADSHFSQRGRLGRTLTFMARTIRDGWTTDAKGIGVDEATALLVEGDGSATVIGAGAAWFIRMSADDVRTCERHRPLETRFVPVHVVSKGDTFDLASWSGGAEPTRRVKAIDGGLLWATP